MGEVVAFDDLTGYLADGRGPGIVVLHEWWGLVPHITDVCDRFAAVGFTAVAPDLYHGATAPNTEPDDAERLLMALDRERAISEVASTVAELRRRGCPKVGTVGFCVGGALSLAASARCRVDATVAYYGVWPHSGERSIKTPILVHVAHERWDWHARSSCHSVRRNRHSVFVRRHNFGVQFSPEIFDRVADGTITLSYRLWSRPKVKVGGVYRSGSVTIEIDEIEVVPFSSITDEDLARTGEPDVETLRRRAAHAGPIHDDTLVYRVEFHVVRKPDSTSG